MDVDDGSDGFDHGVDVVRDFSRGEVDVSGCSAGVVGGQEYAAFEDEVVALIGSGEAVEEAFECVELEEFVSCSSGGVGEASQVEVDLSGDGLSVRRCHSSISSASRMARSAVGKDVAIRRRFEGCDPR